MRIVRYFIRLQTFIFLTITCCIAHASSPVTLKLDGGNSLTWSGDGPYATLCGTEEKPICFPIKMPKTLGAIQNISETEAVEGARTTWQVRSEAGTFICSVQKSNSRTVCAKVLIGLPGKLSKASALYKSIEETKAVLAGELNNLAAQSTLSSFSIGGCQDCYSIKDAANSERDDCEDSAQRVYDYELSQCPVYGGAIEAGCMMSAMLQYGSLSNQCQRDYDDTIQASGCDTFYF